MTTIRQLTVTDGTSSHDLELFADDNRTLLWDRTADPTCDSAIDIPDQSDESIMDAIRDHGFAIVAETAP